MDDRNQVYEAPEPREVDKDTQSFGLNLIDVLGASGQPERGGLAGVSGIESKGRMAGAILEKLDVRLGPIFEIPPTEGRPRPDDAQRIDESKTIDGLSADIIKQLSPDGRVAGALNAILGNPSGPGGFALGVIQALKQPKLEKKR